MRSSLWLPPKLSLHLWPTKVFPNVPWVSPQLRSGFLLSSQKPFISILLLPTPLISIWPRRITESLCSIHRGWHTSTRPTSTTNCLPMPLGSRTLFCSCSFCTCPSPPLEHPSQHTTPLMLSYPQLRRIITSFLRSLLAHPSEKSNSQYPLPLCLTHHPVCFLQRTLHYLKMHSWFTSLLYHLFFFQWNACSTLARTFPNWFAAIFSMPGKNVLCGQMKEWIQGLNVSSYGSVESSGNHCLPLL